VNSVRTPPSLRIRAPSSAEESELLRDAGGTVCHIGWTVLLRFYGRLGYEPWRTYVTASAP